MLLLRHSSTDCNESFRNFAMLKHHLTTAHSDNVRKRKCAACNHTFDNMNVGEIDLKHYSAHGLCVYNCVYCAFSASIIHQMQEHLSDCHSNKLPYYLVRAVSEVDLSDLPTIWRLKDIRNEEFICSELSESQINFMSPLLSDYASNAQDVPDDIMPALIDKNKFMTDYHICTAITEQTEKLYNLETLMIDLSASIRTSVNSLNAAVHQEQPNLNLNAPDDSMLCAYLTSGANDNKNHEASIQNEIDNAAKCLLVGTGLDASTVFKCSVCPDLTLDRNNFNEHVSLHGDGCICHHCGESMDSIEMLAKHIVEHGVHRFFCYYCPFTSASEPSMAGHFDKTHRNKLIHFFPLNPMGQDRQQDIFVVCPRSVKTVHDFGVRLVKRYNDQLMSSKKVYAADELHLLPQQSIYIEDVQCKRCSYKTKVRTNMQRHLQLNSCSERNGNDMHTENGGPVNPMPCLMTSIEEMKSVVASSTEIDTADPSCQFVPDELRYKCGSASCQFRTVSAAMLRQHIDLTHSLDRTYNCAHCKTDLRTGSGPILNSNEILCHLRYHDAILYKCASCQFVHYYNQSVEIHMAAAHPNSKKSFITLTRGDKKPAMDSNAIEKKTQEAIKVTVLKWKCNICSKAVFDTRQLIKKHLSLAHRLNYQYQCSVCPYQCDSKDTITAHLMNNHKTSESHLFEVCYDQVESAVDNTPIWQRDDPTRVSTSM